MLSFHFLCTVRICEGRRLRADTLQINIPIALGVAVQSMGDAERVGIFASDRARIGGSMDFLAFFIDKVG